MLIRFWGARGSIPVSGSGYLKYGGDTTCVEIRTKDDEIIIIDAGSGIRRLGNLLIEEGRREFNLIFTHSHLDHITGLPFFTPLYFKKTKINMYACPSHQGDILQVLSNVITPPYFPMPLNDLMVNLSYTTDLCKGFSIGRVQVDTISLSHPNMGIGFRLTEDGKSFVFLTDNELSYHHPGGPDRRSLSEFTAGADLLVHDAEYTGEDYKTMKGWGHSTYDDALQFALKTKVKSLGLFHHNQNRTDEGIDSIVNDCRKSIKDAGSGLDCFAVAQDLKIDL